MTAHVKGGGLYPRTCIIGAAGITGKTKAISSVCKPYLGMLSFKLHMK